MRPVGFEPAIFGSEDQRSADCAIADLTPLFQGPEALPLNLIVCWSRGSTTFACMCRRLENAREDLYLAVFSWRWW